MLLSRHSVGTYQGTSSHATRKGTLGHSRPLWTDPGLKSGNSVRELISTQKQRKKETNKQKPRRRGMNCRTFSQNSRTREKTQQQQQ